LSTPCTENPHAKTLQVVVEKLPADSDSEVDADVDDGETTPAPMPLREPTPPPRDISRHSSP